MQNILKLIKLEYMLNRKSEKKSKNMIFFALYCFCVLLASGAVSFALIYSLRMFVGGTTMLGELSLCIFISSVILFVYSLSNQLKTIFLFKRKETLAYLPINKYSIYFSKWIVCFANTMLLNILLNAPIIICFGVLSGLGWSFYLIGFSVMFVLPLIPFGLANLILIPCVYIYNFMRNKLMLKLISTICLLLVAFYFYMEIVFELANAWILKSSDSANLIESLISFCENKYMPSNWIANIMLQTEAGMNFLWLILAGLSVCLVSILIGLFTYKGFFVKSMSEKTVARIIRTKGNGKNTFWAYFVLEMKDLFRKSSSLFTYVGMAVAMPIMVYFCNRFIVEFAVEKMGTSIVVGATFLVVMVFISIICSPSASLISKEGDSFWILKTNPNGIRLPLFAKSLVGICFAGLSLVATYISVCAGGFIDWTTGLLILAIALVYIVALISLGLVLNLARPNIFYAEKENASNMSIHLSFGFITSVVLGVFAIVESFSIPPATSLLYCLAIVSGLMLISVSLLLSLYKRLYAKMEV